MRPTEAFIAVTYACNARCRMCNIWATEKTDELGPCEYKKLPKSLRTINITGGEPFLRRDLVDVVRAIHKVVPKARLVFSTNGYLTDTIVERIVSIASFHKRVGVGVSIDGLNDVHDYIRGVTGMYDRAIQTVLRLKDAGVKDLRIAMTLQRDNLGQLDGVYNLSKSLGVEFSLTMAHDSDVYFKKSGVRLTTLPKETVAAIQKVVGDQLKSKSMKNWIRAYHTQGLWDQTHRHLYRHQCEAGRRYFFMSPAGDVYPCNVMDMVLGNLGKVSAWDAIFSGNTKEAVRCAVRACPRDCWMICNTRSLILSHPARVAFWVAWNKPRAHLRD